MMYSAVIKWFYVQVSVGRGSSMVYPYNKNIIMRSHDNHIIDARKALDSRSVRIKL